MRVPSRLGLPQSVEVIIDQVRDHAHQYRDPGKIKGLMIHRVGADLRTGAVIGYDAVSICDAFTGRDLQWQEVARVTGWQNPYTFFVGGDLGGDELNGHVWQALPIDEIGHHARRHSSDYLAVALIGDFRARPPSDRQWLASVGLCADLADYFGFSTSAVVGHGEIQGGNKAVGAAGACPGDWLVLDAFRSSVEAERRDNAHRGALSRLQDFGVRIY